MGTYVWGSFGPPQHSIRTPRLTVRCEYPDDQGSPPSEVTFRLSPSYGVHTAYEAHAWFLGMMRSHNEFVVERDKAGAAPVPFWSDTVRQVVVE